MSIKFKFTETATSDIIILALKLLDQNGFKPRQTFPNADKPPLVLIYTIGSSDHTDYLEIKAILKAIESNSIEYIEMPVNRKPTKKQYNSKGQQYLLKPKPKPTT